MARDRINSHLRCRPLGGGRQPPDVLVWSARAGSGRSPHGRGPDGPDRRERAQPAAAGRGPALSRPRRPRHRPRGAERCSGWGLEGDVAAGITLSSVETLPAQQQGGYRRISLRVACSAPMPVLVGFLQKLEVSSPRMLIDDLDLDASPDLNRPDGIALAANFTVIAFRPGSGP
jgi:hypothetical protein